MEYILIIGVSIFLLFLPGLSLSFTIYAPKTISLIERIVLSLALSISVLSLGAFYLNLIGIPIEPKTIISEALLIILTGLLIYSLKNRKKK